MNELYLSVLSTARSPERAAPLMALVELLYESNYDETLNQIADIVSLYDSVTECIDLVEGLILSCTRSLLERLGVDIELANITKYPRQVYDLIHTIIEGIEDYEDYDSLLAIADSDEPHEIALGNLVSFITHTPATYYHEIINLVSPRLLKVIKATLTARSASELDEVPNNLQARVKALQAFLRRYPTSILAPVFDSYGFLRTPKEMVNEVIIDHAEIKHDYSDQMASVIAGIVVVSDTTSDDIDARVMEVLNLLVEADYEQHILEITTKVKMIIGDIMYDVATEEVQ